MTVLRAKRGQQLRKQLTVWLTMGFFAVQPLASIAAPIVADTRVGMKEQPLVEQTANGIPLVQITAPTAGGVSRNLYTDFSVPQSGAVLNNSQTLAMTKLAGYVAPNPNMVRGTASVIVNEVTSANRSSLDGFIEVAGQRANVVVANPNGITVNGGGFINTSQAILTTGKPTYDANGGLQDLRVTKGDVTVTGDGLNVTETDKVAILARAVQVNAGIWGKEIAIRTGANQVNASTLEATPIVGEGAVPQVGLDASALGGMYANRITLVGTEQGVGVNMAGHLQSKGDLILQSDGTLTNTGTMQAESTLTAKSQRITNRGTMASANDIALVSSSVMEQQGTIASGVQADGSLGTTGNINIRSDRYMQTGGDTISGKAMQIDANTMAVTNGQLYGHTVGMTTNQLTINKSTISSEQETNLTVKQALTASNQSQLSSAGALVIHSASNGTDSLVVTNDNSTLTADKDVSITANHITNGGTLTSAGNLHLTTQGDMALTNTLVANGNMNITTTGTVTNQTAVKAGGTLSITSQQLVNATTKELTGANVALHTADTVTNEGLISATKKTEIEATTIDNQGTGRIYGDSIQIQANQVRNNANKAKEAELLSKQAVVTAKKQEMESALAALAIAQSADAASSTSATEAEVVTKENAFRAAKEAFLAVQGEAQTLYDAIHAMPAGTIAARQNMDISATTIQNSLGATIYSEGDMRLGGQHNTKANTITNHGATISAQGSLTLAAHTISNTNAQLTIGMTETDWLANGPDTVTMRDGRNSIGTDVRSRFDYREIGNEGEVVGGRQDANHYIVHPDQYGKETELPPISERKGWGNVYNYAEWDSPNWQLAGIAKLGITPPTAPPTDTTSVAYRAWKADFDAKLAELAAKLPDYNARVHEANRVIRFEDYELDIYKKKTIMPTLVSSAPGSIQAGKNISIDGAFINKDSAVVAGGAITANQAVQNESTSIQSEEIEKHIHTYSEVVSVGLFGSKHSRHDHVQTQIAAPKLTSVVLPTTTTKDHTVPNMLATPIASPQTQQVGMVGRTIPNSSLYQVNPNPTAHYLIETDSAFTNKKRFLSSDYMFQYLQMDPDRTNKRLGDGYYEQTLIRQQITELTGFRYLEGYTSDEEEYRTLMDQGLVFAKQYGLKPGIELTKEQMAALTTDIVWLVKEKISLPSGEVVELLVPKVYIHNGGASALRPDGALISGSKVVMELKDNLTNSGTIVAKTDLGIHAVTIDTSGTLGGNRVLLSTTGDMNVQGAVIGKDAAVLQSEGNVNVTTATYHTRNSEGSHRTDIDRVAGIAVTGDDGVLVVSAKQDLHLSGAELVHLGAQGATVLSAGKNLTLDTVHTDNYAQGIQDKDNYMKDRESHDVGTSVQTKGNLTMQAEEDVTAKAAHVESVAGAVKIVAGQDVTFAAGEDALHHEYGLKYKESGLLSSTMVTRKDDEYEKRAHGTTLAGEQVQVVAGRDVLATAANVLGTKEVAVAAGRDLTMTSGENVTEIRNTYDVKKSGLMAAGGLSVMVGTQKVSDTDRANARTQAKTVVASDNGNLTMVAGNQAHLTSTDVVAKEDITVAAQNVTLDANTNYLYETQIHKERSSGLSIGITSPTISRVETGMATLERAASRNDKRLGALEVYDTYREMKKDMDIAKRIGNGKKPDVLSIRVGIGSNASESTETTTATEVAGGSMKAGDALKISAFSHDATKGNLTAVGETLSATDVQLLASQDISLIAGKNVSSDTDRSSSKGWGAGVSFRPTGSMMEVDVSAHQAKENGTTTKETYTPTVVTGTNSVATVAGRDTTLIGSAIVGNTVTTSTGRDLTVTSLQETETYQGDSKSAGFSLSSDWHSKPDIGASASVTKTDSTYASVKEQAGIYAGVGGFAVTTGRTTKLTGAVLDSMATPDKNTLTTERLVMEDIQNKAEYKQRGMGVSYTQYSSKEEEQAKNNDKGFLPTPMVGASGKASSITKSAIAPGTIQTKVPMDVEVINRDAKHSLNELGQIFDKKKLEERQELARLVAKYAYEQLHQWEPKTDKERAEKAIAHGMVAEAIARLGGSTAGSGFAAGAINEAVVSKFQKEARKHPEAAQWASLALGAMVNGALGKPVQSGGAVAQYGTKWNNGLVDYLKEKGLLANGVRMEEVLEGNNELAKQNELVITNDLNEQYKYNVASGIIKETDPDYQPPYNQYTARYESANSQTTSFAYPGDKLAALHPERVHQGADGHSYIMDENGIDQYTQSRPAYTYEQRGVYDTVYKGYPTKNLYVDGKWINVTMYPDNSYVYNRDSNDLELADIQAKQNANDFAAGGLVGYDNTVALGTGTQLASYLTNSDIRDRSGAWYYRGKIAGDVAGGLTGLALIGKGAGEMGLSVASVSATGGASLALAPAGLGEIALGGGISSQGYTNLKKDLNTFQASKEPIGTNGTQVTSKTVWKGKGKERVDVENPNPGERDGNIHYHDKNNKKYYYDSEKGEFFERLPNGERGKAPKAIQDKLTNDEFIEALDKASNKYLGEQK